MWRREWTVEGGGGAPVLGMIVTSTVVTSTFEFFGTSQAHEVQSSPRLSQTSSKSCSMAPPASVCGWVRSLVTRGKKQQDTPINSD